MFDRRKIRFSGIAGEIVIPPKMKGNRKMIVPAKQLARTPTNVGFEAGWFHFMLATVHIIWGEGVEAHPERVAEIREIASFVVSSAHVARAENRFWVGISSKPDGSMIYGHALIHLATAPQSLPLFTAY